MENDYKVTPIAIAVHLKNDNPIFGESSTHVCIDDEVGGPFITLKQSHEDLEPGEIKLDIEELKIITKTAEKLIRDFPVVK